MRYRFVDCRWDLADPEAGRQAYLEGHIPGASFLDVDRDLSSPPGAGGRHPLPAPEHFAEAAGRAGIGDGVFVVAYGRLGGAERLWWLLRHFGHDDCAVLELDAWHGPLRGGDETVEPATFVPRPRGTTRLTQMRSSPAASSSSTRGSPLAGAARRTRSTRCPAGSPERSTHRGTSLCRSS